MAFSPTTRVWRYMSFAKFVWILQMKQLWLTNARFFDDKWEVAMDGSQINRIINNRPSSMTAEDVLTQIKNYVTFARKATFVSCWNASKHESHALWRIYCPTSEGIAIQTTLDRLRKSVEPLRILEVFYTPNADNDISDPYKLAAQKRPMFAYEEEVRVVLVQDLDDHQHPDRTTFGTGLPWDPEAHIENIWLHPEAPHWFAETVTETVRRLAPKLSRQVWYSKMNTTPPV
jgi:hypothetical protein